MGFELTSTTTAMCNSFIQKYWSMVAPIHKIKNQFRKTLDDLEVTLSSTIFSSTQDIANQLNDLQNTTKALIPEDTVDAVREVKNFVDGCECFFGKDDGGESAVGIILGAALGIYDQIDDYVGQITYPEFKAGGVANILNKMLDGAGLGLPYSNKIADLLKEADCMASCMSSLCPGSASELQLILNDIQELYNVLRLDDDPNSPNYGKIKYDEIYSAAGMAQDAIVNMESTIAGLGETSTAAVEGITKSVTSIKTALKGGLF